MTKKIPRTKELDSTAALVKEGFLFFENRRKKLRSDMFETRLMGKKTLVFRGEEAAKLFYNESKFQRKKAIPKPLRQTLTGEGAIHGTDDTHHKQRKRMFLSMMTPERIEEMKRISLEELEARTEQWTNMDQVVLYDEMELILTRAACRWAGVPLKEEEAVSRAREMGAMVDSFGGHPAQFKKGKKARESHEDWLKDVIRQVRRNKLHAPPYTPAYIVAHHRDDKGKKLDVHTAAVDLSNAFRPLIAAAYFLVFGALAIHENPEIKRRLQHNTDEYGQMFTQEVRRFYPFAPAMGAVARETFEWNGYTFKKGQLCILDFYGTNHHPSHWEKPEEFRPERFKDWKESPFSFIPMGGGDHHSGHRCAGEWITVMVMKTFFEYITTQIRYDVPEQQLDYDLKRMPTLPKSRFVVTNVAKIDQPLRNIIDHNRQQTVIYS
ncbi:cytochrome P450 [Bacillus daqingensis]|uniref:Cytochrome P450 n=1 Tax=Bacillus daqingensis TaxID=872396 RepID=A0ABV9P0G4_9BACI